MTVGTEWLVDAYGCLAKSLRDVSVMRALLETVLFRLELHAVGDGRWHKFPGEGGVTGLYLLTESHLAVHTYPEHRTATFNLYCCRWAATDLPSFPWVELVSHALGAQRVDVTMVPRGVHLGPGGPQ